ncbi:hypothetical protein CP8484711_0277B, partial [Chlamydia psittaci 84-8471/1]
FCCFDRTLLSQKF